MIKNRPPMMATFLRKWCMLFWASIPDCAQKLWKNRVAGIRKAISPALAQRVHAAEQQREPAGNFRRGRQRQQNLDQRQMVLLHVSGSGFPVQKLHGPRDEKNGREADATDEGEKRFGPDARNCGMARLTDKGGTHGRLLSEDARGFSIQNVQIMFLILLYNHGIWPLS